MKLNKRIIPLLLAPLLLSTAASAENHAQDAEANSQDYPQVLVQTNMGNFTIELFAARAPITVKNFLQYVQSGQYEGTVFHRVVPGFVLQGGGFDTNYEKKPTRGNISNESGNGLSNRRGWVAMARTSDPHSADAQFYINLGDNLALDPRPTRWGYAVFGKVIAGMEETVDQIGYVATGPGPVPELSKDVPNEAVIIERISIVEQTSSTPPLATETE